MSVIFEPAEAIAAARCLTARSVDPKGRTVVHDRECGWCAYDLPGLKTLVDGFNEWAGFDLKSNTYKRHEVRVFQGLPRPEQQRLIEIAQDFPPAPAEHVVTDEEAVALL